MDFETLLENFSTIADAPEGIQRLRSLILELAVQGRLNDQETNSVRHNSGIPVHWTRGPLEDFAHYIQRGKGPKYTEKSSIPVVSQKCVKWSGFDITEARFIDTESLSSYKEERFLRAGDLLWNSTGTGTVGRTSLFIESTQFPRVVADSHVTVVRSNSLDPRFLWCWTASPTVQAQILGSTTGSTNQQELNLSTVKALTIAFPAREEQTAIVRKVDELMAMCDELESATIKRNALRTAARKSVINAISAASTTNEVEGAWIRVSNNWLNLCDSPEAISDLRALVLSLLIPMKHNLDGDDKTFHIGEVSQLLNGDRSANYPSKEHRVKTGIPFINAGHLRHGQIDLSEMDYITEQRFAILRGGKLEEGDVLFCLRGSLGKCAITTGVDRGTVASSLAILRPDSRLKSRYLLRFLESDYCLQQINKFNNGTAQPNLSAKNLGKFEIVIPSLKRQEEIIKQIDNLMSACDELKLHLDQRQVLARKLVDRISQVLSPAS
jgi:type I restriction enzyme S subunit